MKAIAWCPLRALYLFDTSRMPAAEKGSIHFFLKHGGYKKKIVCTKSIADMGAPGITPWI